METVALTLAVLGTAAVALLHYKVQGTVRSEADRRPRHGLNLLGVAIGTGYYPEGGQDERE